MKFPNTLISPSPSRWLSILGWAAVSLLGTFALAILAWSRGETVNALWLVVASVAVFAISHRFHSAWLMAKVAITGWKARALRTGMFAMPLLALAPIGDKAVILTITSIPN